MLRSLRILLSPGRHPVNSVVGITQKFSSSEIKDHEETTDDNKFAKYTRLRKTADHTLPGLPQLRSACKKILQVGVTDPSTVVEQLHHEVGQFVAMGRFVIDLHHPSLLETIERLINSGMSLPQILQDPSVLNKQAQDQFLESEKCKKLNYSWLETLAKKLNTTSQELLHRAPRKMNAFYPRSQQEYLDKINVLLNAGATTEDILDSLSILNRSLSCIRSRCDEVKAQGLVSFSFPIKLVNQSNKNYEAMVKYRKRSMDVLGSHSDAWHCLAEKLESTPELIRQRFRPFDLVATIQKIDMLLDMGLTRDDILLRPRLVTFSTANILRAKLVTEDHDLAINAGSLSYFLEKSSFPMKKNKASMMEALCVLLNCQTDDIRSFYPYLDTALTSPISAIEKSIKILLDNEISLADICECPMVLNHSAETIERAFKDEHLLPLSQWNSRRQLLNALVYTMDLYRPATLEDPEFAVAVEALEDQLDKEEADEIDDNVEEIIDDNELPRLEDWLLRENRFSNFGFSF